MALNKALKTESLFRRYALKIMLSTIGFFFPSLNVMALYVSVFAGMEEPCLSTQLIDGDGVFNVSGLESFLKEVKLAECGLSYAVVSIMGPQSSGMICSFPHRFHHV
jgi:hypothetical protein